MKMILVPGYRSLFGEPTITYEELLKTIPSEMVISIAIALNNELNAPIEEKENQNRIRQIVSHRFSTEQLTRLNAAYRRFSILANSSDIDYVFARRYLLAMVLRETRRNSKVELKDVSGNQEFNFLMAYFLVIDEVNTKDSIVLESISQQEKDSTFYYKLIWTSYIPQFQMNEKTNIPFEIFKLLCLLKYSFNHLRPYLKEYLHSLNFDTVGKFLHSFFQIAQASLVYNENAPLSKLNFIRPAININTDHLDSLSINSVLGNALSLPDIKKLPLFKSEERGYMIIDHNFYLKKFYKGPFFDLYKNTKLKTFTKFNTYSSDISKFVLEKMCFEYVMSSFEVRNKYDVLHFDDGSDSSPDCYFRSNQSILLFELKGYLFPDEIPENPDFDVMRRYIDERFILSEKNKPKGIGQILVQLDKIVQNKFTFDSKYSEELCKKNISIYPVIVIDDFNFTMPSLNEYLNERFLELIAKKRFPKNFRIQGLTIINLDLLYEIGAYGGSFEKLQSLVARYHRIIDSRKRKLGAIFHSRDINSFLNAKSSFDEIYHTLFVNDFSANRKHSKVEKYVDIIGITQDELDHIL